MFTATIRIAALLFLVAAPLVSGAQSTERRMAITIDDLPTVNVVDTSIAGRRTVTMNLLRALTQREIPATGFVNEIQLYEDGTLVDERVELLRLWLSAGMDLGNHAYSHPDLHRVSLDEFKADVMRGETVTRGLLEAVGREPVFFRHPYLHTGIDLATKRAFEEFLAGHGYRVAPVSIDNSEWIFARAYFLARQAGDDTLADRIGSDYVSYMLDMVDFYESQSSMLFDRNIAHVFLIHANELNSQWFGALADQLSQKGYAFVTLEEAITDPAYESEDTYTGPGGITWLHRWAITRGEDPAMFAGEPRTPDYILKLTELPEHGYQD